MVSNYLILLSLLVVVFAADQTLVAQDEKEEASAKKVYSGPQVGEALPVFQMKVAIGERKDEDIDLVKIADEKPVVVVFLHEKSRPAFGAARVVLRSSFESFPAQSRRQFAASSVFL